jgi:hypothetical protein
MISCGPSACTPRCKSLRGVCLARPDSRWSTKAEIYFQNYFSLDIPACPTASPIGSFFAHRDPESHLSSDSEAWLALADLGLAAIGSGSAALWTSYQLVVSCIAGHLIGDFGSSSTSATPTALLPIPRYPVCSAAPSPSNHAVTTPPTRLSPVTLRSVQGAQSRSARSTSSQKPSCYTSRHG